jgi:hypothetical protein
MIMWRLLAVLIIIIPACSNVNSSNETDVEITGEEIINLNGWWHFSIDSTIAGNPDWINPEYSSEGWDELLVPGNWDTENNYAEFVGTGHYRKEFSIPENWEDNVVRLHFAAVYQTANVWLNGQYLGMHTGGYTPFEFNISEILRPGKNVIALSANNEYGRGAWWHWGGISRDVKLIKNNEQRIVSQRITTEPDLATGEAKVHYAVDLTNHAGQEFRGMITVVIENLQLGSSAIVVENASIMLAANANKTKKFTILLNKNQVQLWDVENPNLYKIHISLLSETGSVIHKKEERFGIRKIETRNTKVLLNGKELRMNGFNRVADHRAFGQTEPDVLVKFDIDAMKAMGCNFTRINHHPQSENLLNYCDEVGMLLIEEIPVWQDDPHLYKDDPEAKRWLEEMITRDYNHPSIIGWSVANEIHDGTLEGRQMSPRVYDYVESMINHVQTLDSNRLKTYVSFTAGNAKELGVDPADVCDIISFTSYGDASKVAKRIHEVWPNKPVFVAEIGLNQFGDDDTDAELPANLIRAIKNSLQLDYVVGVSLWTYNDYRSNYGGTPPSQNRAWGVYNVWRQPKPAAYQIQQLFRSKSTELPSLNDPLPAFIKDNPFILAVVPLENSCVVGFSVIDEKDNYEIEYTLEGKAPETVKIQGLQGAAKIYDLEPGNYFFRIRRVANSGFGKWSPDVSTTIVDSYSSK